MAAGRLPVFAAPASAPVLGQNGQAVIAAGQRMSDEQILKMNWFVDGVQGTLTP